jgi:ATP-binding cassette, subfamily C, bacterial CydD
MNGASTPKADAVRGWLNAAAVPGRSWLQLAATAQTLETVFTVVQWAALAWVAQGLVAGRMQLYWPALGLLFAGGILAAGATSSAARLQAAGRQRISRGIRQRLVTGLLPSGQRRVEPDAATAALAIVELTDDVADYHAQALPQRLSAPASMAVILLVTAVLQWPAALILVLASVLIPPNMRLAGLFAREGADERVAASTRLGAVVLESFRGMRTLRSIGALERRRGELALAAANLNATTMAIVRRAFLSGSIMDVVVTFSIAADATYIGLSLLGYIRLDVAPPVTLFSGLAALLLCPMYFQPLRTRAAAYHSQERALSAVATIRAVLGETETVTESRDVSAVSPVGPVAVVLDNVTFRVLRGVDLQLHAGHWTALVGPSGVGKTTLLSLIAGVGQPISGSVRWITSAGAFSPHLGSCAWIGQHTVLLPGSIGDNIRIARPGASEAEVECAVVAAGLSEVIARLPGGLDTELGEGGYGLSTGEARRIAIARAFLRDAELWILDEPTAHLDPDAEAQVIDALKHATRGQTVIVATHSVALARSADTVLSLADGTIRIVANRATNAAREPIAA